MSEAKPIAQQASGAATGTETEIYCPDCGYNLRGITSERCPECGLAIDREHFNESRIPWVHRRQIGRVRAYWRTVLLVMFNGRKLGDEVARPVDYREARKFQRTTVMLAWAPIVLAVVGAYVYGLTQRQVQWTEGTRLGWVLEWGIVAVGCGAIYLFLLAATGVGSYFYHPKRLSVVQQNRAVALSYYACAPLAWVGVVMAAGAAMLLVFGDSWMKLPLPLEALAMVVLVAPYVVPLWCWFSHLRILARATHCGMARVVTLAVSLPLMWALLAALVLGGIVGSAIMISLFLLSIA